MAAADYDGGGSAARDGSRSNLGLCFPVALPGMGRPLEEAGALLWMVSWAAKTVRPLYTPLVPETRLRLALEVQGLC